MKKIRLWHLILVVLIAGMFTNAIAEEKFDKKLYDKIAKKTIGMVISGNIDADKMIADMGKLIDFAVQGCKEYMKKGGTPPKEAKIMKIVVENAKKVSSLTMDEIEEQWHDGGVLKANGIDIDKFDRFSEVISLYAAVVHPATAAICFNEYKKTKKEDLLDTVKDELEEIREHLKYIK